MANDLRKKGIDCEIYPSASKLQKQMKYANDRGVKFTVLIGENELNNNTLVLKNMDSGEQVSIKFEDLVDFTFS